MSNEQDSQNIVDLHMTVIDKQVEEYQLSERISALSRAMLEAPERDQVILYSIIQDYLKPHLPKEGKA